MILLLYNIGSLVYVVYILHYCNLLYFLFWNMYFYISGNKYRLIKCRILCIIANINKLQYKYKIQYKYI